MNKVLRTVLTLVFSALLLSAIAMAQTSSATATKSNAKANTKTSTKAKTKTTDQHHSKMSKVAFWHHDGDKMQNQPRLKSRQ